MAKEKKSKIGAFILGSAIGAGLGVLFAPKKGSETRADLKKNMDELLKKIKDIKPKDVKEAIEKKIDEIQKELADLDKEKVVSIAKSKAKAIAKKADDLVKLAVKKGTPVLQKAAEDVRLKTIDVLNETVKKLEEKAPEKKAKKATKK